MMKKLQGKKILITGAAGFLATYLAEECFSEGAELFGIDINPAFSKTIWKEFSIKGLSDSAFIFEQQPFDFVFHLAGGASVIDSVDFPSRDFNNIIPPTFSLIESIKKYSPQTHLILFSSAAVYGSPKVLPVKESADLMPLSPYGIHKVLAENLVTYYSKYFHFKCSVLRIFSAFGEGLRKQLFWDVIKKYKAQLEKGDEEIELQLYGTGAESRDFIHAKDVAKAALLIATSEQNESSVFNVACGKEITVNEAVHLLFANAENKPRIKFSGASRIGDPEKWRADISKLETLGFSANITAKDGLNDYYKWAINL